MFRQRRAGRPGWRGPGGCPHAVADAYGDTDRATEGPDRRRRRQCARRRTVGNHDERAWRLRHAKRSVLKDSGQTVAVTARDDDSLFEDSLQRLGRAVGGPASAGDVAVRGSLGQRPDQSADRARSIGRRICSRSTQPCRRLWRMGARGSGSRRRLVDGGTLTQGDLSSWIVSGSYRRKPDAAHAMRRAL